MYWLNTSLLFHYSNYRGQIIKKMVAHYYFQMFFCGNKNTDELCVIPNAGAKEAWELISEHKNMFDMYKKEHYIMMSLIRLLVSKKSAFDCNL